MKLAIAQINSVLGDLSGNVARILQYAEQAERQGARLLLTPELGLCGYPPEDLLLRAGFYEACAQALGAQKAQIILFRCINAPVRPALAARQNAGLC